jgi:hypothetical protein
MGLTVAMADRRAIVIGSQCNNLTNLSLTFLPGLAESLFGVLTDPERGGCSQELSRLLLDPADLAEMDSAIKQSVSTAHDDEADLVVAFIGHAEAVKDRLYLLPVNGRPQSDAGFQLGLRVAELIGQYSNLHGLVLLLDACQSGVGVADLAVSAAREISEAGVRTQLFTSTFNQASRDGCFTNNLHRLLRDGIPELSNDYLLASDLAAHIEVACKNQDSPRLVTFQSRWVVNDPGLWLGRNVGAPNRWLLTGTNAGGQAVYLTEHLVLTETLQEIVSAWQTTKVVILTGDAGAGKSAVVAALTRPELAPDIVSPGMMHGVAFAAVTPDVVSIAESLASQLRRLEGFGAATDAYRLRFGVENFNRQPALTRLVVGPLQTLGVPATRRIRLAIDGLDQMDAVAREGVVGAARVLSTDPSLPGIRLLLTTRPATIPSIPHAQIIVGPVTPDQLADYWRQRNLASTLLPTIAKHAETWLDVRMFADLAQGAGGSLTENGLTTVEELYDAVVAEAADRTADTDLMEALLALLTSAGAGPVLPLSLLVEGTRHLGNAASAKSVDDAVVTLAGLVVRARAGTPHEQLGLFHETLVQHQVVRLSAAPLVSAHQALASALEADAESQAPSYRAYSQVNLPKHLWSAGHKTEALEAVFRSLGQRPTDNLGTVSEWLGRAVAGLGPDHSSTLETRGYVAWWTREAGDVTRARDLFVDLLADLERVLGPDDPGTLTIRGNVASCTGEVGDVPGARDLFADLLADQERVLDPDDPIILATRGNVARWTGRAGDVTRARDLFADLLADQERVLDPDDPIILATRGNVATWTGRAGDVTRARDLFADLLADLERVLDPDDSYTLATRGNVASWTGEAGEVTRARDLFADVLADQERVLGPDHPSTLATRDNQVYWSRRMEGMRDRRSRRSDS